MVASAIYTKQKFITYMLLEAILKS